MKGSLCLHISFSPSVECDFERFIFISHPYIDVSIAVTGVTRVLLEYNRIELLY